MYRHYELNNGFRVLTCSMPWMRSVSLGVWIAAGGRYEAARQAGISHFLEHLLFKGTRTRSAQAVKKAIEGRGGSLNGFTSEESTCYLAKVLDEQWEHALEILSDMVLNARLDHADIETERGVILEEIKMYLDHPMHYVSEVLKQLLWPNQPLGRDLTGTPQTVRALRRVDLVRHQRRFYAPRNAVLVVVGRLEPDAVVAAADRWFGRRAPGQRAAYRAARNGQTRPRHDLRVKATEQTHLSLGIRAFGRTHLDCHALSLLHIILGANMSSRLFEQVREQRGLAYEIGSQLRWFRDAGAFIVNAGVRNGKAVETVRIILRELKRLRTSPVRREEFTRAKDFYAGQLTLVLEDPMEHMIWLGEQIMSVGQYAPPDDLLRELERVTPEDVSRVAGRLGQARHFNLAGIGPFKKVDEARLRDLLRTEC